jgi:hypothetical protein
LSAAPYCDEYAYDDANTYGHGDCNLDRYRNTHADVRLNRTRMQDDGAINIPVTRHVFEIGGTLQYSLVHSGKFRLLGGAAVRADLSRRARK